MNKENATKLLKRVARFNTGKPLKNQIQTGFSEGRGYFFEFPDNDLTAMLFNKRVYLNAKNYTEIGFLINRYEESGYSLGEIQAITKFITDELFSVIEMQNNTLNAIYDISLV